MWKKLSKMRLIFNKCDKLLKVRNQKETHLKIGGRGKIAVMILDRWIKHSINKSLTDKILLRQVIRIKLDQLLLLVSKIKYNQIKLILGQECLEEEFQDLVWDQNQEWVVEWWISNLEVQEVVQWWVISPEGQWEEEWSISNQVDQWEEAWRVSHKWWINK